MLFSTSSTMLASSCGSTFSMSTRGCTMPAFTPSRMFTMAWSKIAGVFARALQPVVVVLDGRRTAARWCRSRTARSELAMLLELVDGQQPVGKLELLERRFAIEREDLVREPVLAGEAFGADGPARDRDTSGGTRAACSSNSGRQEIRQLGVVARIAGEGGGDRVELEVLFPELRVQRVRAARLVVRGIGGTGEAAKQENRGEQCESLSSLTTPRKKETRPFV